MRNLKRALSLALASVMLLGMMVVGSNAAIADVDPDKHNVEALEVLKLVKAMVGDGTNINPDQLVTRNEAAVVVSNLLGVDKSAYAAHPFTDVPSWANSSVAVCYAEGITGGVSATEFGGNQTITTLQAGLFVLKALDYFQGTNDFAIDGWQKATAKAAASIGLFKGVSAGANEGLTRNDFAQIVFNALNTKPAKAVGPVLAVNAEGKMFSIYTYETDTAAKTLMNTLFTGDKAVTKSTSTIDDAGRPTVTYTQGKDSVAIAIEPDYAFTMTKATESLTQYMVDEEIVEEKLALASGWDGYVNGKDTAITPALTKGNDVEVYLNDNDEVKTIVVLDYALTQVGKTTELTEKQIKDNEKTALEDAKSYTMVGSSKVYDIYFEGNTYAEKDYILAAVKDTTNDIVLAHKAATVIEGTIEATKDGKLSINGTYYTKNYSADLKIGDKGTWALDEAGKLGAAITVDSKSSDYAYIYRIARDCAEPGELDADGFAAELADPVYTAYVVLTDGTKAAYEISAEDAVAAGFVEPEGMTGKDCAVAVAYVAAYELEDGVFALASGNEAYAKATSESVDKDDAKIGSVYANAATKFIFVNAGDSKVEVSTAVGYKTVEIATTDIHTISKDGVVLYAFVPAADTTIDDEAVLAVVIDPVPVIKGVKASEKTWTYSIAVDGKPVELVLGAELALAEGIEKLNKGDVITYEMTKADEAKVTDVVTEKAAVSFIGDEFVDMTVLGQVDKDDLTLYTLTNDDGTYSVSAGAELSDAEGEASEFIYYTDDSGKTYTIFVLVTVEE